MPATPSQTSQTSTLPNPIVYLNYFPPAVANQFEFARNLFLVTLGALLADMCICLPADIDIVRSGLGPSMVAYCLARLSTLAFVLSCVIVKVRPEAPHCNAQELGVAILWIIATASSSFLFLRRAHAVFYHRKLVQHFYTFLYVANVGISLVVPIGNRAGPLADTGWCINTKVATYVTAAVFSRLVFDSCVFLGISYEIATTQTLSGVAVTWRTIITGKANSRLMRAVLRGGQQYYLISVCSNLLIVLLIVIPGVPDIYQAMFNVPDIALSSSMACRVFRNLRVTATCTNVTMTTSIEFPSQGASVGFGHTTGDTVSDVRRPARIPLKLEPLKMEDSVNK